MQKQVRLVSMEDFLRMHPVNQFLYNSRTVSVKVSLKMVPVNRLSVLLC